MVVKNPKSHYRGPESLNPRGIPRASKAQKDIGNHRAWGVYRMQIRPLFQVHAQNFRIACEKHYARHSFSVFIGFSTRRQGVPSQLRVHLLNVGRAMSNPSESRGGGRPCLKAQSSIIRFSFVLFEKEARVCTQNPHPPSLSIGSL